MTNTLKLKDPAQAAFDEFVFRFDTELTVPTARIVAKELGVDFDPENYDH
jgi:hypothetical protein